MEVKIHPSWKAVLKDQFEKPYFQELAQFVKQEYQEGQIYPPPKEIFRAFDLCPFDQLKVVLLGQDPYHGPKQANGMAFAVHEGLRTPPSLQNIFKEIQSDLNRPPNATTNLENWAKDGVLLLNATLTVRAGQAGSHQNKGWETFTDAVIETISEKKENIVFLLWGKYAQAKEILIDSSKHLILKAPHPSPFSADRGFFGCKHFSKTNKYLASKKLQPISW